MGTQLELSCHVPIHFIGGGLQITREATQHLDRVLPFFDLIFVQEGTLPIQEDEQIFEVKAGQSLLLWPGRHHFGTAPSPTGSRLYWVHFSVNESTNPEPSSNPLTTESSQLLSVPQHAIVARPEFLESLLRRLLDDGNSGRLLPAFANSLVWLILQEIADQRPVIRNSRTAAAVAQQAQAYIRSHLQTPLTVAQIAEKLGYNPDYLNRVFQQVHRHTISQEIQLSRVGYARHLLLHSSQSVKEIALDSGFQNLSHFARVFKRYEGMTATEFRRLNAQVHVNFD